MNEVENSLQELHRRFEATQYLIYCNRLHGIDNLTRCQRQWLLFTIAVIQSIQKTMK